MKIVFLNHFIAGGGAERVTCLLTNNLVNKGYSISMMTDLFKPFAYDVDEKVNKINLFRTKEGSASKLSFFYMVHNVRSMTNIEKPVVIIGVLPLMNLVAIIAAIGTRTKVIATHHTSIDRKVGFHIRFIQNYVYRLADKVTYLTQTDIDYLGSKIPQKVVMPNPLACHIIDTPENSRKKNILAVGRLDIWKLKGFDLLLDAWAKIADNNPEWTLDIAGGGRDKSSKEISAYIENLNLQNRVNLLDFRKDISEIMSNSSIFALTSRVEGFGMVLIEAMANGCACVSFDDGGRQSEIISSGIDGIIVNNHDSNELSQVLQKLINDDKLRLNLAKNALKRAEFYSLDRIALKWENLIKSI